jgi:hypothetical protein
LVLVRDVDAAVLPDHTAAAVFFLFSGDPRRSHPDVSFPFLDDDRK